MRLGIVGMGAIGASTARLADAFGHSITAVADADGAAVDDEGVDVQTALEQKQREGSLGEQTVEDALDAEYDCLLEVSPPSLGEAEPAFSHIATALDRDRHVVLGNKGPVALRYGELQELVLESEGQLRYESTIDGVLPVLSTIADIGPDHIVGVRGVFNGFANFILSRMTTERLGYEHVLAEAQDLGVADVDPTFDVEGTDSALTCSIIANELGSPDREFTLDDVDIQGITEVEGSAIDLAKEDGMTIRLIGEVQRDTLRVAPRTVSVDSPLAISGSRTVVELNVRHAGRLNVSSSATSSEEIASAILTDVNRLET